jgi:17beta-estradiol 17-dehydrogenase / very-long-chain 3-oxoacyl-CoA reductase
MNPGINMNTLWYFELVGVIAAGYLFIDWGCEGYYYLRALCARRNLRKYGVGTWALVTGSTDGIGLGFAKVLAKYGFNLVLVSRNIEKLTKIEEELKAYPIEILKIAKDISKCPEDPSEFFTDIDMQTRDLDVSIVVNNVGGAATGYFHEIPLNDVLMQNALNLWPIVYLSKIYVRRMLNRSKPSALINVSSTGSIVPLSGTSVYCAGKSFDHLFTLNLNEEVRYLVKRDKLNEIDILSLQPSFVDTPMVKDFKARPGVITPEECAENALRVLGKVNYSSCHWKHLIYSMFYRNIPTYINSKFTLDLVTKMKGS